MKLKWYDRLVIFVYVAINTLFVYKYAARIPSLSVYIPLFSYLIFVSILITSIYYFKTSFKKVLYHKTGYWFFVSIVFLSFIGINILVDGNTLTVDRWSALELTVEGYLEGIYPYTRTDHLGQMSSNFPALGLLGLPFYILGDVGYLQAFVFLFLAFYLYKVSSIRVAILTLFLLICSPSYLYEIWVKSDLMSNVILFCIFFDWFYRNSFNLVLKRSFLLGLIIGFLILTRAIVIIPLVLFIWKPFFKSTFTNQTKLIGGVLLSLLVILSPIAATIPDLETFLSYNPLVLQTNKAPTISYLILILPFILAYLIKRSNKDFFYTAIMILTISLVGFFNILMDIGWNAVIHQNAYDIAYISMCMPFVIFALMYNIKTVSVD